MPTEFPKLPFVGLEHVEPHTTKLLGFAPSVTVKSLASRFYKGDVLYGRLRPYLNKVWCADRDGLCSGEFIVFPAGGRIDPMFLAYRLSAPDFVAFTGLIDAGDRPRVNFDQISSFELALPNEINEQHAIVAFAEEQFSRLDAGIAVLRRAQANLKRYRASVLKAACEGRLVPTEAELARQEGRDFETGSELLTRILVERRRSWSSEGRCRAPAAPELRGRPAVPEGWVWSDVGQLAEVGTGATPKRGAARFYEGGSIPWVTSGALNGSSVVAAKEFVTDAALKETNLTLYPSGTLLIAMYGEGKTRGKCSELGIAATTNQAIAALQAPAIIRPYLKLCLASLYEVMRRSASGGVQPNLNLSLIREVGVPLPPLAEQERIVAEVERRLSVADQLEATIAANLLRATRLRQSILQQAFGGSN